MTYWGGIITFTGFSSEEEIDETVLGYAAYKDGDKSVRKFTPLSFLAELQQHVFATFEQNTR